ncbi:hypothetical protein [Rubrivirga sp.]|uniref:hypothetical protein n=1 Tax=Rubrivirga sp. TaxID=1885344 RepID=UPI003C73A5A9
MPLATPASRLSRPAAVAFGLLGAVLGLALGLAVGAGDWSLAWPAAGFLCAALPARVLWPVASSRPTRVWAGLVGGCVMVLAAGLAMLVGTVLEAASGGEFFAERPGDLVTTGGQFLIYLSILASPVALTAAVAGASAGVALHHRGRRLV